MPKNSPDAAGVTSNSYVEKACEYIHNNYQKYIGVSDVAAHVAIDRTYLFKQFCAHVGMSPSKYIKLIRLSHAKELIDRGNIPLSEIPKLSGFCSRSRFTEIFKSEYGISPKDYANNRKNS